jgi:hypothetical protein
MKAKKQHICFCARKTAEKTLYLLPHCWTVSLSMLNVNVKMERVFALGVYELMKRYSK